MIRTQKNEVINTIVNEFFIQDWFRDHRPIIAGGSILYLYLTFSDENSIASKHILSKIRSIKKFRSNKFLKNKGPAYRYGGTSPPRDSIVHAYGGDIDVWFSSEKALKEVLARAAFVATPCSSTGWAESFNCRNLLFPKIQTTQIIKSGPPSVEALIQQFDIANAMIAWHDGKLYIDDRLDYAFSKDLIEYVNNPFDRKMTIGSKLFNALRLFKYAERYGLSFSQEINEVILPLYLEVDEAGALDVGNEELVNSAYGKTLASSNTLRSMASNLSARITTWYGMDTFREENLAFLIGLKSPHLEGAAKFVRDALGAYDESTVFPQDIQF